MKHPLEEQLPAREAASLSLAERDAAWRESVKNLPRTPPLSDAAISRESIYTDDFARFGVEAINPASVRS